MTALLLLGSYFLGAFPTSLVAGRVARGIDLRDQGSGNLGTTNVFRVLGWRWALPVLVVDVFKGWFPTFYFPTLLGLEGSVWPLAFGAVAILGHVFSVLARFRGGKGVATSAGVFLALAPVATLSAVLVWGALVWAMRIVSVASLAAAGCLPVFMYVTRGVDAVFWLSVAIALFVFYSHRANIRRLLRGEEAKFGRRREAR